MAGAQGGRPRGPCGRRLRCTRSWAATRVRRTGARSGCGIPVTCGPPALAQALLVPQRMLRRGRSFACYLVIGIVVAVPAAALAEQLAPGIEYEHENGYRVVTVALDSDAVEARVAQPHAYPEAGNCTTSLGSVAEVTSTTRTRTVRRRW